jgi:hypothetical protein
VRRREGDAGPVREVPVLPGSSLKGAVRSVLETVSFSCVPVTGREVQPALAPEWRPCGDAARLCPACRLFGMSSRSRRNNYQGQVSVEDVLVPAGALEVIGTPVLWSADRDRLPPRYLQGGRAAGRKVYYHGHSARGNDARLAVRPGTELTLRLHATNLDDAEAGLLLTALGLHPRYPFWLKVGAGKPVGMGSMAASLVSLLPGGDWRTTGRLGGRQPITGEELARRRGSWCAAAASLFWTQGLERLYEAWRAENTERQMPEGPY